MKKETLPLRQQRLERKRLKVIEHPTMYVPTILRGMSTCAIRCDEYQEHIILSRKYYISRTIIQWKSYLIIDSVYEKYTLSIIA